MAAFAEGHSLSMCTYYNLLAQRALVMREQGRTRSLVVSHLPLRAAQRS